ncbi:hypothetical protein BX666DRAFT_2015029 [Dichotomocladium elegans]|nr:hypothetical protein BX666DRAFT_2015029 [Dichotomocladium elegans]
MIDNSDTEILAIRTVFNDGCQILLCFWHILRAWRKNIRSKVMPHIGIQKTMQEKRQHRDDALQYLAGMMYADTEEDYNMIYDEMIMWAEHHQQEWDVDDFIAYFDSYYAEKKEKWSRVWRRGNYNIDTNNFIESWHQSLKEVYLSGLKRQRVNVLIYILWDVVLPSVMTDHAQTALLVKSATMTKAERDRYNAARDIQGKLIIQIQHDRFPVFPSIVCCIVVVELIMFF